MSVNPFPGLRPFARDQSRYFFGRDQQITDLLHRLKTQRMAGIIGASGCGKSSVVFAGVLPALERGFLAGPSHDWHVIDMRPGGRPLTSLAVALSNGRGGHESIEKTLATTTYGLTDWIAQNTLDARGERRILIFTDQFEELFTFAEIDRSRIAASNRRHFVDILLQAAAQDIVPVYWLLTMRTEYLGRCGEYPGLADALNRSQYLVPNLSREQLALAITAPLEELDEPVEVAPALVQQLLNDSADERDQLPLLQHCLMRTFSAWAAKSPRPATMGLEEYEAAKRIDGALDEHGSEIFNRLTPAQQLVATRLFRNITRISEEGVAVRRPTLEQDLREIVGLPSPGGPDDLNAVVETFARPHNSFISVSQSPDGTEINLTHECLARKWKLLRTWIREEAESVAALRELRRRAERKAYAIGRDLAAFKRRRNADKWNAPWVARYADRDDFAAIERFLHRSDLRNWALRGAFALLLAVLAGLGLYAERQQHKLAALNEVVATKSLELEDLEAKSELLLVERAEARAAALKAAEQGNELQRQQAEERIRELTSRLQDTESQLNVAKKSYRDTLGATDVYAQQSQNLKDLEDKTARAEERLQAAPYRDDRKRVATLERQLDDANASLASMTRVTNDEIQKLRSEIADLKAKGTPAPFLQTFVISQGSIVALGISRPRSVAVLADDIRQGASSQLFVYSGEPLPAGARAKDIASTARRAGACGQAEPKAAGEGRVWCFTVVKDTVRKGRQTLPPFVVDGQRYTISVVGYLVNPFGDEQLSLVVTSAS